MTTQMHAAAASILGTLLGAIRWLALPIAALLFLQWPLREWLQAYSREANDLGQILFAVFVAASVTAATRAEAHIAADVLSRRFSSRLRRNIASAGFLLGVLPWVLFVLWSSAPLIARSIGSVERFQDTANPGYFVIKAALWLLAGLMLIDGLLGLWPRHRNGSPGAPDATSEPTNTEQTS